MGGGPEPYSPIVDQMKYVVLKDPSWDWRTFDFEKDIERFDKPEYLIMNATDPNLSKFFAHGGRLLIYHGWSDQNVSPYNTVKYFKSAQDTMNSGEIGHAGVAVLPALRQPCRPKPSEWLDGSPVPSRAR